jgi:toxin secretion/phage lysis holin
MKEKRNMWRAVCAACAGIGGVLGWFFGGLDGFMWAMIVFVLVDYITGVTAAAVKRELSSEIGAKGIAKKVFEFLLVGIANVLDRQILKNGAALRTLVIFFYVANEGLSILENCTKIGLPVPKFLKKLLKQLKDKGDGKDEEINIDGKKEDNKSEADAEGGTDNVSEEEKQ